MNKKIWIVLGIFPFMVWGWIEMIKAGSEWFSFIYGLVGGMYMCLILCAIYEAFKKEAEPYEIVKEGLIKLGGDVQLAIAKSIISSIAVQFPRSGRKQFLKIQFGKIEDLSKDLVADNKESK